MFVLPVYLETLWLKYYEKDHLVCVGTRTVLNCV